MVRRRYPMVFWTCSVTSVPRSWKRSMPNANNNQNKVVDFFTREPWNAANTFVTAASVAVIADAVASKQSSGFYGTPEMQAAPDVSSIGPAGLIGGGGDGTSGGMESRVAVLETHVEHIRKDLDSMKADLKSATTSIGEIKTDTALIKERMSNLPTSGKVVTYLLSALAVLAALSVFSPTIQKFVGTAPPPVAAPANPAPPSAPAQKK